MTKERSFLKAFLIRKSVKYLRKIAFLISTDVASRGLDFPVVDIIVHYDINPDKKDYVNRREEQQDFITKDILSCS